MLTSFGVAAESPYVGAGACRACHPQHATRQANTHHAKALQPAADSLLAQWLIAQPVRERNGTSFEYQLRPDGLHVTATQERNTATGVIEWIFGAGALAFTPVGRDAHGFFEHRVSWYSASRRPGMTLGHPPDRPSSSQAALGRRPKAAEISSCFGCHASGVRAGAKASDVPDLQWMEPGVQCERCHGPGRSHTLAPTSANIAANRGSDAKAQVAFCAQCHRAPDRSLGVAPEQGDPMLIRFAPVGLSVSRCFVASGTLTCLTCHDPHENARQDAAFYTSKCQQCHAQAVHATANHTDNCVSCHMPKRTPVKDLTFTDHRIRIVRDDR